MDVWVLEWSYPYDGENTVTVWASEADAQKQALKEISDMITNDWDMDEILAASCADDISDMMARGQFGEAVKRFNDYQDNHNSDYAQYYWVTRETVRSYGVATPKKIAPMPFKATTLGATCRGPCGQHNEYAMADQADGTHVCYQCSTFQHIFGVKS